ncbi:hypothetical protein JG688_00011743 [Phytophthora aleatoria]|uniref:Uncharacterized protein n=1 Tax=Phytophthora aleatoria TaxID=2496075 RepID=A0A8J5J3M3_9STRA|nr:hypothetical protein JG688_00011743 [Phytophthora aleatoria]
MESRIGLSKKDLIAEEQRACVLPQEQAQHPGVCRGRQTLRQRECPESGWVIDKPARGRVLCASSMDPMSVAATVHTAIGKAGVAHMV